MSDNQLPKNGQLLGFICKSKCGSKNVSIWKYVRSVKICSLSGNQSELWIAVYSLEVCLLSGNQSNLLKYLYSLGISLLSKRMSTLWKYVNSLCLLENHCPLYVYSLKICPLYGNLSTLWKYFYSLGSVYSLKKNVSSLEKKKFSRKLSSLETCPCSQSIWLLY